MNTSFCRSAQFAPVQLMLSLAGLLFYIAGALASEPTLLASRYNVIEGGGQTGVIVEFDQNPVLNWVLLRGPYRLSIDLPRTKFAFEPEALKAKGLISHVRFGDVGEAKSRLILTSRVPFKIGNVDLQPVSGGSKHRLHVSLVAATVAEFDAALHDQAQTTAATVVGARSGGNIDSRFTIVIDPGHGGVDGGALGVNGTNEKDITLLFSRELKETLEESGQYKVLLTRENDAFLRLDDRVAFARDAKANLFISIHADTIRFKGVRGATVYTVSDEASDAEAAALAARENVVDQIAGFEVPASSKEVADVLVDLVRRETHGYSIAFARSLVEGLRGATGMINNPHRHAGFRVLRAPDVPSVLVELGYLSNPKDEKQLLSAAWREKVVDSVVQAIGTFSSATITARQ